MSTIPEGYEQVTIPSKADGTKSNIYGAWFNSDDNKFIVQFARGLTHYRYSNFTQAKLDEMLSAPSAGSWLHKNVTSNPTAFPVEKL